MRPFRPGLVPTLVVLALLPGLIALGCWQLGRADEKRALMHAYTERQLQAPVAAAQLGQLADPAFYPVHLYGRFDGEHSLLLDNQMRDGKAGVELLQPYHDQASGQWLLVNRGWLAWPDRRIPVRFDTPAQPLALDATVYVAPGKAFQLHPDPEGGQWPHLLTAIDPAAYGIDPIRRVTLEGTVPGKFLDGMSLTFFGNVVPIWLEVLILLGFGVVALAVAVRNFRIRD